MLLLSNDQDESKAQPRTHVDLPIFATRIAFRASLNEGVGLMNRMHWIVGILALGSLLLGSLALGTLALGGSALAGGAGGEVGIGLTFAPGQQGTSPGQVFNAARATDPSTALPPGKLYLQNKSNDPTTALPPGQTFTNYGRSKK